MAAVCRFLDITRSRAEDGYPRRFSLLIALNLALGSATVHGQLQPYFYHDIPTTAGDWLRERHSGAQHGRIAVLKPDKWCSYMEYHLKLVSEGLLEGDRWHLISVQENLLFSYLEEPRTHVNIRHKPGVPSAELQEWLAVDPESHFEHFAKEQQGPDAPNFVYLPRCAGTHE